MKNDTGFLEISDDDIKIAFKEVKTYMDISLEDFKEIYIHALNHARTRLLNITVDKVMTKNVMSITKKSSVSEAIHLLSESKVPCLPVVDDENTVIGIITRKDIIVAAGVAKNNTFKDVIRYIIGVPTPHKNVISAKMAKDIMTSPAITVPLGSDIKDAANKLLEMRINNLPVVSNDNKLAGIISTSDIVNSIGSSRRI
ncbi:MAG: CBS domain-containing protein [Deltaproteobacteria bacterium]|nr:CBS domain-containing protein [Deltaproteobacteria bacterium]